LAGQRVAWCGVAQVRHVTANPLQRSSLAGALDVSLFRCALVLCDELWVDPDNNDANGLDSLDEPCVLRLDSLVMVAQVNTGPQWSCRYVYDTDFYYCQCYNGGVELLSTRYLGAVAPQCKASAWEVGKLQPNKIASIETDSVRVSVCLLLLQCSSTCASCLRTASCLPST
jgi:hypothetical protein